MESLLTFLTTTPPGEIKEPHNLPGLLSECWSEFKGPGLEAIDAEKLSRMEKISWNPPILQFTIHRFGGTVKGSLRAEVQRWTVNTEQKTAALERMAYPKIITRPPSFNVSPIADELAWLIKQSERHPWLIWSANGSVQVLYGRIPPVGEQKTLDDRRKRLNKALERRLAPLGWKRRGDWWEL